MVISSKIVLKMPPKYFINSKNCFYISPGKFINLSGPSTFRETKKVSWVKSSKPTNS